MHYIYLKLQYYLKFYLKHSCRGWFFVQPGEHKRKLNGILGLLCRQHFPGLVMHAGVLEPAYT